MKGRPGFAAAPGQGGGGSRSALYPVRDWPFFSSLYYLPFGPLHLSPSTTNQRQPGIVDTVNRNPLASTRRHLIRSLLSASERPRRRSAPILLALFAAGCVGDRMAPDVGNPAPPFEAVTLDGTAIASTELAGTPYMLNIWATWCAPCRDEMPKLEQLYRSYAARGFQVVGVSVDDSGSRDQIVAFTEEVGVTFPIYHEPSWAIMDAYLLLGLPGTFLIDRDGRIVRKWTGPFEPMDQEVQENVRALLDPVAEQ